MYANVDKTGCYGGFFISITSIFIFGFDGQWAFDYLREQRQGLLLWIHENRFLAGIIFFTVYVVAVALCFPGATWITLGGGFLFGTIPAMIIVVLAATTGSTIVFLITRYCLADYLHANMSLSILKVKAGFQRNSLSYMLFLRLIPVFPFWLVNIVPGLLNVPLRQYIVGTFLGIIPGCIVYCSLGSGLGEMFDSERLPDRERIFQLKFLGPIIALAIISLLPIAYKLLKNPSNMARVRDEHYVRGQSRKLLWLIFLAL